MSVKKLLPIGSVILLEGAEKKLMIFGIRQQDEGNLGKEYDYVAVPYPEGNVGVKTQFLFNHSDIKTVVFTGYEDEERDNFIDLLENYYNKTENQ